MVRGLPVRWQCIMLVAGVATSSGCSKESDLSDIPPPGKLQLISANPLEVPPPPALNPNGDFREWYAGASAPTGFEAPRSAAAQSLTYVVRHTKPTGGYFVRQMWKQSDQDLELSQHFGFVMNNLKPDTEYNLTVRASYNSPARISAAEIDETTTTILAPNPVIELTPGAFDRVYTGVFRTQKGGTVKVYSHSENLPGPVNQVHWLEWQLREGPAMPVPHEGDAEEAPAPAEAPASAS